jgi:hypothetical protein
VDVAVEIHTFFHTKMWKTFGFHRVINRFVTLFHSYPRGYTHENVEKTSFSLSCVESVCIFHKFSTPLWKTYFYLGIPFGE